MNDLGVIDRFLDTFARYIDSGFGLLQPEVAYLSSTLVVIDITLAALFWAMGGEDVMPRLVKKILYVGAFAFIIGNFNWLASIIFRSFAGLGLKASGATIGEAQLLQPGRLATVGVQAAQPILDEIGKLAGFPSVFTNIDTIVVLFVAWIIVIVAFFILAVQLFVSVLEFKLTTLAGFVLVPFALWNRTSFLAEKVLGNVVASGIKVLVLAVIVGIGTGLFSEFQSAAGAEPTISDALAIVLASVSLLGLGIFGPGIANGLVSGAPQLGAGSAVGTAAAGAGLIAAGGMGALAAGRAAGGAALGATHAATSLAGGARAAYAEGAATSGATGMARAGAGVANVARSGASAAGDAVRSGARRVFSGGPTGTGSGPDGTPPSGGGDGQPPAWANRLRRGDTVRRGVETAAHTIRSADHGGAGPTPDLKDPS
ncbi:P-type conjugative transfer protein TrbL [Sphingomonas adhaesiva]|uniref:P-type conjugative transfer protein TrbL n=1 Tax=Sphingomonas adhaesiva TaxID=28212 RepID=UPI002FF99646